jgi:hypothetical protein
MNPWVQVPNRKPGRFRVGDRVRIVVGFRGAEAEVLEDHGPLGVGGRRSYTIRLQMRGAEEMILDYAEDEMEPLTPEGSQESPRS